jgi:hypothetical protein
VRGRANKDVSLNEELQGFTSIKMVRKIYEKRIRGMSRRWIHVRPNGNPNGALAGMLTASASLGTVKYFIRTRRMEPAPRGGCFMVVVGSGDGENGKWCWRTRKVAIKVGIPSPKY